MKLVQNKWLFQQSILWNQFVEDFLESSYETIEGLYHSGMELNSFSFQLEVVAEIT